MSTTTAGAAAPAWHYSPDGQAQQGPVSETALRELLANGTLQRGTLVWREGMADWQPLESALELPPADTAAAAGADDAAWSPGPHPWRRYFSRGTDYIVIGLPTYILAVIPLSAAFGSGSLVVKVALNQFAATVLLVCLFPFVEAVFLSTWGFTPTRALMGVHIRNRDGSGLRYMAALRRSWQVALQGMGLGIPVVNLVTNVMAYNDLKKSGGTDWDRECHTQVRHRRWSAARGIASVLWCVLIYGGMAAYDVAHKL